MKFFTALLALPAVAFAASSTLTYDPIYDNKAESLNAVACSNGPNGLENRGFTTFGSLPNLPNIGGVPAITSFDSVNCGTCWNVTYTNPQGAKKSIHVLGIDTGLTGFNVAEAAMNTLTGGQALALGRVDVTYEQIASSICGL